MTLNVELSHVTVRYGNVTAINDLTLSLPAGKIYGLLGRNGSGKTTLLSLLAAFRKANSGTVLVGGTPIFENPTMMRQVCLIGAGKSVHDKSDSVQEAFNTVRALRPTWDTAYATALVERFRLPLTKKIGDLSLGQQSTLGVIMGLASRAPLTMFDESYLGMDVPSRLLFHDELLADFMAYPRTIILSTHLMEELSTLFEEVIIIDRGKLLLQDNTEVLRARGATVTGSIEAVDRFAVGLRVLTEKQLGRTKSAVLYGTLQEGHHRQAQEAGLELQPLPLQELFTHLTQPVEHPHES